MLRLILTSRVYDVCRETPLDPAPRLSRRLGTEVLLKREDLQPVFSFKLRGAYNKIAHLRAGRARPRRHRRQRRQPRAGRRLLGAAARHPRRHRHAADDAARSRCDAVRDLGAEVVLAGDSYADAKAALRRAAARRPA